MRMTCFLMRNILETPIFCLSLSVKKLWEVHDMSISNPPSIHCSFLIPVYQEEDILPDLFKRLDAILEKIVLPCEVVLIDDGSTDLTPDLLRHKSEIDKRYQCIFLSKNYGQQRALLAGLSYSRGQVIQFLDADLQDPPELYFTFIDYINKGYDVVYGIRKKRKEGFLKRWSYSAFYRLFKCLANIKVPLDSGDFGMITRRVAKAIIQHPEDRPFIRGLRSNVGFAQIGIPYERASRSAGKSKYTFRKLVQLGLDGLFNFTAFPIKVLVFFGVISISSSLIYFGITVYRKYVFGDVPTGFSGLLFAIILFGGFQLLALGVLGEYIQRIFFQVKNRPRYIIKSIIQDGDEHIDK